jgi:hypothetical protein
MQRVYALPGTVESRRDVEPSIHFRASDVQAVRVARRPFRRPMEPFLLFACVVEIA